MTMPMSSSMPMMEHPEDVVSVPALVDERVLMQFCKAVQNYADGLGLRDEAAIELRLFQFFVDRSQSNPLICTSVWKTHILALAGVGPFC
jgi:hypothetical protein